MLIYFAYLNTVKGYILMLLREILYIVVL
jgi:hypothetical protein